jgi:hypothetical protein
MSECLVRAFQNVKRVRELAHQVSSHPDILRALSGENHTELPGITRSKINAINGWPTSTAFIFRK